MKERYAWWREHKKLLSDLHLNVNIQRLQSLERLEKLERLEFSYLSYEEYEYRDGDIVYCDIPYKQTSCKQYKTNEDGFNHEAFWKWAREQPYDVYVSERIIPDDVEVILTKEVANRANTKGIDGFKTEYLVKV